MNKEGSLDGVAITSTEAYKELILRGTGNDMVNLPHFFFKHLEWKVNDRLQLRTTYHRLDTRLYQSNQKPSHKTRTKKELEKGI